jgi:hypothetical protein
VHTRLPGYRHCSAVIVSSRGSSTP